ncbi:universal stress protein [Arsenicicoccus piscis]|uniref:UspA domain-containing protein n=1 Tax=Arsenicicoccus piscis TaxID=673954 RepID=A0ABQ6HMJ5_9MICO|nr:universal stress protein [Arsenicicoccus piscis]MCH8627119.1 universal stress protein [Arsenicicoccus piscis]GMA18929.1 hypothetical protein GCM10025862_09500 [Arsenicicoccus piscis]
MSVVVGLVPTKEGRAAMVRAAEEAVRRRVPLIVVDIADVSRAGDTADLTSLGSVLQEVRATIGTTVPLTVHAAADDADLAEELITVAEQHDADTIVIGLRQRSATGKLDLGSNAQRILLDAGCPVITVKG